MPKAFVLPLAAISALTLAACDTSPQQPSTPSEPVPPVEEPVAPPDSDPVVLQGPSIQETIETIEREANETFQNIMEQAGQTGEEAREMSDEALQAIGQQAEAAADSLNRQVDAIIANLETMRDQNLSQAQRLEAVNNARTTAEQAARLLGRNETEARAVGDDVERRARTVMGLN